jgi:hypothetical protein
VGADRCRPLRRDRRDRGGRARGCGRRGRSHLVVGAIGERAFAEAGRQERAALKTRFKLAGKVALVAVGGLGAELTGQLSLQMSLLDGGSSITFLFDAGTDVDAAAVLRRQVPALGLKAKLFGATADSALLWRAADVIVARPRPEVVSRVQLVGGKLVALIDDSIVGAAKAAAALEARKRCIAAKGLLLLSSALDTAFTGTPPGPTADGGDNIADIVAAVAADKRGVIDERRAAAHAATRDRVRAASAAATAAAATTAMPGDLEDLGGTSGPAPVDDVPLPDAAELARLHKEVERRRAEMTKSMMAARDSATTLNAEASSARISGNTDRRRSSTRRPTPRAPASTRCSPSSRSSSASSPSSIAFARPCRTHRHVRGRARRRRARRRRARSTRPRRARRSTMR